VVVVIITILLIIAVGGWLGGELRRPVLQLHQHAPDDVLGVRLFHPGHHVDGRLRRLVLQDDDRTDLYGLLHSWRTGQFVGLLFHCKQRTELPLSYQPTNRNTFINIYRLTRGRDTPCERH